MMVTRKPIHEIRMLLAWGYAFAILMALGGLVQLVRNENDYGATILLWSIVWALYVLILRWGTLQVSDD